MTTRHLRFAAAMVAAVVVAAIAGGPWDASRAGRRPVPLEPARSEHGPRASRALAAGEPLTLTVLHTNDVHAHVDEWATGGVTIGGAARLATEIARVRAAEPNVLLVDAGDQFQGTLFFNVFRADAVTATMNALDYDAMAVGNHEFDHGPAELARFVDGANFPVLGTNIAVGPTNPLTGSLRLFAAINVGGQTIGLIGLTTPSTASGSSPGPDVTFADPATSARAAVADLAGRDIDKVVALTHLGYEADLALARAVSGIDVIVGGHSHTLLRTPPDCAAGPYPTVVQAPDGRPALVVTAGEWGRFLGELTVVFDGNGVVERYAGNPVAMDQTVAKEPQVEALVASLRARLDPFRHEVVGESTVELPIEVNDVEVCRFGECLMGDLVADAALAAADPTWSAPYDVAILNGGGLRAPIDVGPITVGEVMEVLPFGNTLATFAITGTHLVAALENGVSQYPARGGRFPQVAGLRFGWNPDRPAGARIASVEVRDARSGRYAPLDTAAVYRVVTNNFMRGGGDGYTMLRDLAIDPYDFGPALDEAVIAYIRAHTPIGPALEGRIYRFASVWLPLALPGFALPAPGEGA